MMINETKQLLLLMESAISSFNKKEQYLIKNDLSERCICSKFAMYLQAKIKESSTYNNYIVNVEYNRGAECQPQYAKVLSGKKIVVDIIVHTYQNDRINGFDNLICCEMKKSTNKVGCELDEERLNKMTSYSYGFNYKLGVMLLVDMDELKLTIKNYYELH